MKDKKIVVATCCNSNYAALKETTSDNMEDYCEQNGYIFQQRKVADYVKEPSWSKINYMLDILESPIFYTHVLWMDTDSMFVDFSFKIETMLEQHPNADIITARDYYGICCSNILVCNTDWSRNFLKAVVFLGRTLKHSRFEQDSIKLLYANYCEVPLHLEASNDYVGHSMVMPVLNRPIAHYPNLPLNNRLKFINETRIQNRKIIKE